MLDLALNRAENSSVKMRLAERISQSDRRPVSLRDWARLLGLTGLVFSFIAYLQGVWILGLLAMVGSAGLFVFWASRRRDPDFKMTWPYEYAGDADVRSEGPGWRLQRLGRAATLATVVYLSWIAFDPTPWGLKVSIVPAAFLGIWGYEIPAPPPRWILMASLAIGLFSTISLAGLAVMGSENFSSKGWGTLLLVGAVTGAAFTYVILSLGKALFRSPHSLI